jgi:MFS family permease
LTRQERQGWLVVASLFVTLFLIFGSGYNTAGVFFTPLLKQFGWSRARLSLLTTTLALSAGLSIPLIGWLLDRVEARVVMTAGALLAGISFLMASQINSFAPLLAAYVVLGVGIAAATLLPCSMVVANWFGARRGTALGLTMAGTSLGGMIMTLVADRAIRSGSWRTGYLILAVPMFVVVVPMIILVVRTRPPGDSKMSVSEAADSLPGLEVAEALRTRSFWMLALAQLFFAFAVSGMGLHLVPYLIGLGYAPGRAALVLSIALGLGATGKLVMGSFADRISARIALFIDLVLVAIGMTLVLGVSRPAVLFPFLLIYGLSFGAPLTLIPLAMAESLGLKRFGSLAGLGGIFNTIGAAIGPVLAGRLFDSTARYSTAFELFAVALLLGAAATYFCRPLEEEEAGLVAVVAAAEKA